MRTSHHQRDKYFNYMAQGKKRKVEMVDDVMYLYCTRCQEMKSQDNYTINRMSNTGLDYYCRQCNSEMKKNPKENYTYKSQKDFIETMFKNMGYDINDDISEQFNNKIKEKYGIDLS